MSGYDWANLLADHGGEELESLVASLLIRQHPNARQVNPSQGDGGIDIVLDTADGRIVWQVKRFASPLLSSQWSQVKKSWIRLVDQHVDVEEATKPKIIEYNLVTPWTPTEERYEAFKELTQDVEFPAHWRGEAWLNGLADQAQDTMQRFKYGPNALEQFLMAKAMIAGSPVELSDSFSMLEALERRESALDGVRDKISENYSVRRTVSAFAGDALPIPPGPAAMHHFERRADGDWVVHSVSPKSSEAAKRDPISLEVRFREDADDETKNTYEEWLDWGVPFKDLPMQTLQSGGPFGAEEFVDTHLSVALGEPGALPPLTLKATSEDGEPLARVPLTVVRRTEGVRTDWKYIEAVSAEGTLTVVIRIKLGVDVSMAVETRSLTGLPPDAVCHELGALHDLGEEALVSVVIADGQALIKPFTGFQLPGLLQNYGYPIARSLRVLQRFTPEMLAMPDLDEVQIREFTSLQRISDIYDGNPLEATWSRILLQVPEDAHDRAELLERLKKIEHGEQSLVLVHHPEVSLGSMQFSLQHPLVEVRRNLTIEPGVTAGRLKPGQEFSLIPQGIGEVETALLQDWTAESGL